MSISSMDEDDFGDQEDEDELLQRAVEEQSRRDLHYVRPPNHPPPIISPSAAGPPARQPPPAPPPRRPPPPRPSQSQPSAQAQPSKSNRASNSKQHDEDEESDIELLSLSSEDEEEDERPPRRRPLASNQGKSNDEFGWDDDDEEPDCWKRVDESGLSKMVREMREAKISSALNIKRASTLKRKSSAMEAFPRGEDFIDPLGLGVVDTRNVTLILHGSNAAKREDNEVGTASSARGPEMREKIMYHSENFDPKLFLSYIHYNTSHADLESGEQALKSDLQSRKQQLKQLVKENFDCFVSCKNTIDDIHLKLQQIEADTEGAGTVHLSNSIYNVVKVANKSFGPLFERQVQAEKIRSVQGILQRFRTLFNLPSTIRNHIMKGEYDLAVREYKKAKSLVLPTHVRVLKRVLEEVEKVISEFKEKLFKSMEDPNVELSELESTVRLLVELEPGSDPIWHYLTIQNSRIQNLIKGCSLEHSERMAELERELSAKAESDARWRLQQQSNKASGVDYSLLFGGQLPDADARDSITEKKDALYTRLIHCLTKVLVQFLPSFWRLAVAIFNGKFAKVSQGGLTNGLDHSEYAKSDVNFGGHTLDEVVPMVNEILSLYKSEVLNAFLALAETNVMGPHMQRCVEEISKAASALESKDAAPTSSVQLLSSLKFQITQHYIQRLCSFMQATTLRIEKEEDWIPVSSIERDSSPFAISWLPIRFRSMLTANMDQIDGMLEKLGLESSEVALDVLDMQESVKSTFYGCFYSLRDLFDKMALSLAEKCEELEKELLDNGSLTAEDHFCGLQAGVQVANPHQKLLMILSNVGYCKTTLLSELSQKYNHIWLLSTSRNGSGASSNLIEKLVEAFSESEENVLGQYTRSKATLIGSAAGAYFLDDIQWWATPAVKGIRDAAIELLHPIISVHAELYGGAKPYLEKALPVLIESLMDALLNVFNQNKLVALRIIDLNGFCQLSLELSYLERVLKPHFTKATTDTMHLLRRHLKEKVIDTHRELEALGSRRSQRGVDESVNPDDRLQNSTMSIDDLNGLEQQVCAEYLDSELRRTRLNTVCFTNGNELIPDFDVNHRSLNGGAPTSNHRSSMMVGSNMSRHRRRQSGSSVSDSDSGKPSTGYPPQSPLSQSGYASSDIGSETGLNDRKFRSTTNTDWHSKGHGDARKPRKAVFDDDLR